LTTRNNAWALHDFDRCADDQRAVVDTRVRVHERNRGINLIAGINPLRTIDEGHTEIF